MASGLFLTPDLVAMTISGLITGALAIQLAREPDRRSTLPAIFALAFATLWAITVVLEFLLSSLSLKLALVTLKPFCVIGLVTALLVLAIEHTGTFPLSARRWYLTALLLVPATTVLVNLLPEDYHLYRYDFRFRAHGPLEVLTWTGGPWDKILHSYGYVITGLAFLILGKAATGAKRGYKRAMLITASSWLVPFVGDILTKLRVVDQEVNLTGYGMGFAAIVSAWALLVERLFSVGPIARSLVVEQMGDLFFVLDSRGHVVDCNAQAAQALGLPGKRWLDARPSMLSAPWPEVLGGGNRLDPEGGAPGRIEVEDRVYARHETLLRDHRGYAVGRSVLLHDVSHLELMRQQIAARNEELARANLALTQEIEQRKVTEKRLIQAERMETVGRLAGGVAHDFNNLLTVINGYSTLLLGQMPPETTEHRHLEQIQKAGERAAELTRQLLAFSRRQPIRPRVLNLNSAVTEAREMLSRLLPENIAIVTELDPEPVLVVIDPGQVQQVLMNLATNARDAMPGGGTLRIRTARTQLRNDDAETSEELPAGPYVMLSVADTGVGIGEEDRPHIFEPFYTTREVGQGTGLGLSMVYGIVRQNQGGIMLDSTPGIGSCFRIYLRQSADPMAVPDVPAVNADGLNGNETILVVEDMDAVREVIRQALRNRGYRVLTAANGAEAMAVADGASPGINLLLTDLMMPGMTGLELARKIRLQSPNIRVLCMSGHSENIVGHQELLAEKIPFLQKPMPPDVLVAKVREVLQESREGL